MFPLCRVTIWDRFQGRLAGGSSWQCKPTWCSPATEEGSAFTVMVNHGYTAISILRSVQLASHMATDTMLLWLLLQTSASSSIGFCWSNFSPFSICCRSERSQKNTSKEITSRQLHYGCLPDFNRDSIVSYNILLYRYHHILLLIPMPMLFVSYNHLCNMSTMNSTTRWVKWEVSLVFSRCLFLFIQPRMYFAFPQDMQKRANKTYVPNRGASSVIVLVFTIEIYAQG